MAENENAPRSGVADEAAAVAAAVKPAADGASADAASAAATADTAAGAAATVDASPADESNAAPKRVVKKNWITAGVVAAVVAVAAGGLWVWHETPSFCGAICHSPMNAYVETYDSEDPGMLAAVHAASDETCLSCHEPKITEQIGEAMKWVADDYPMTADGTMLATGVDLASEDFCATGGCHDMADVVSQTWGFEGNDEKYNPHSSHQDLALTCGDCHKAHKTSELVCNECHNLNMPEGWEAPNAA